MLLLESPLAADLLLLHAQFLLTCNAAESHPVVAVLLPFDFYLLPSPVE
jgi:hypothetical protein